MYDIGIINGEVYMDNRWQRKNIYIESEKIALIDEEVKECNQIYEAAGMQVIPGLIDSHVHLAMPAGKFMSADDYESGSRCAVYGGVTTIINFLEETDEVNKLRKGFAAELEKARKCAIDYSFHTSVANMKDSARLFAEYAYESGMPSIKVYTTYKDSGSYSSLKQIAQLLSCTSRKDVMVMCHAEKDDLLLHKSVLIEEFEECRPVIAEIEQVRDLAELCLKEDAFCYIVHVSAGSTVKLLKEKYNSILHKNIWLESVPHYFLFNKNVYLKENNYLYTMCPPLRSEHERLLLEDNLDEIDVISTDHCPFMISEKRNNIPDQIPMGIGSLEYSFITMYSRFGDRVIPKFTENQARLHGLLGRKGFIKTGYDADITIFKRTQGYIDENHSSCDYSIYNGRKSEIKICSVLSRGKFIMLDREYLGGKGGFVKRNY